MHQLQTEHATWLHHNFPDQEPWQPLLGMTEEVGEIAHAFLKHTQKIRGFDDLKAMDEIVDGIGDLVIYLASFCNSMDISLAQCVEDTWDSVKRRDWQVYPTTGLS